MTRRVCALALLAISGVVFSAAWPGLRELFGSAISYRLHHEVAAPLCVFLTLPILGLAALARAAELLGHDERLPVRVDGASTALLGLAVLLLGLGLLFENEWFFSLYDPKGFPVHPPEIVAFPWGRWVTPRAHAFASAVLVGVALVLARGAKSRVE